MACKFPVRWFRATQHPINYNGHYIQVVVTVPNAINKQAIIHDQIGISIASCTWEENLKNHSKFVCEISSQEAVQFLGYQPDIGRIIRLARGVDEYGIQSQG